MKFRVEWALGRGYAPFVQEIEAETAEAARAAALRDVPSGFEGTTPMVYPEWETRGPWHPDGGAGRMARLAAGIGRDGRRED